MSLMTLPLTVTVVKSAARESMKTRYFKIQFEKILWTKQPVAVF